MKTTIAFGLIWDLKESFQIAFLPTLKALLKSPLLIFRPSEVSRIFMSHVWSVFGPGIDGNTKEMKEGLITPNATGVVLDIGAGYGHTALYLDPTKVTKYVALEPNVHMHPEIRARAASQGFTEEAGTLVVLPYGAEETALIVSALGGAPAADTLVAILTLCTIPQPEAALAGLVGQVLKPGGTLVFYEHVLSPREDVAWWQRFWTPLWSRAFDGCRLDRPTHVWLKKMDEWAEGEVWGQENEAEEHLFWHQIGRFVKKSA